MGWTWGLELGLRHWSNSATIVSSLTSSEESWSGMPGLPLESGSRPIVVGPGVDPEIWCVVSEDNPLSSGPIVCRWGRVWSVAGDLGRT